MHCDRRPNSSLETFENETDFKSLVSEKDNAKTRTILLLPPLAVVVLLSLSSTDPTKTAMAISASSQDAKSKLKNHEDFDSKHHSMATNCALAFLWCHHKSLLIPFPCGAMNEPEIAI